MKYRHWPKQKSSDLKAAAKNCGRLRAKRSLSRSTACLPARTTSFCVRMGSSRLHPMQSAYPKIPAFSSFCLATRGKRKPAPAVLFVRLMDDVEQAAGVFLGNHTISPNSKTRTKTILILIISNFMMRAQARLHSIKRPFPERCFIPCIRCSR